MNKTSTTTTTRMMTPQSSSPSILNHESSFFSHDHTRFTATSNSNSNNNCNMFFIDSRVNPSSTTTNVLSSSSQGALFLLQQQQKQQHQSQPSATLSTQRPKSLVHNKMKLPFPYKLHQLLTDLESMGRQDIAGWLPGGKSFRIDDPQVFVETVMTSYFRQSKFTSFIRQLYIYGFAKIESGSEVGGYWHPEFRKSDKTLCLTLGRNSIPVDRRCKKKTKKGISTSSSSSRTSGKEATRKVQPSQKKTKTSTSKVVRLLPPPPEQQLSSSTIPSESATTTTTTTLIAKEDSFTSCIDAIPDLSAVSLPRSSSKFFTTSYSSTSSMLNATFPPLVSTSGIEGMVVVGEGNGEVDHNHNIANQDSSLLCLLDLEPRSIEEMMLQQS